jgi:hypothetical protein
MTGRDACIMRGWIDEHFARRLGPRAEAELRAHLPECAACRQYYERHLVLASLDPAAPPAVDRLAAGLGLARPRPARWRPLAAAAVVAGAASLALLWAVHAGTPEGFTARGAADEAELLAYRLEGAARASLVAGEVARADELAFAYRNPRGHRRLLVFGVDEHGHVFWYHPAWNDAHANPAAVAIAAGPGVHELPEAIAHDLDGQRLFIHAVFTDREITVREIEGLVAKGGGARPVVTGARETILEVRVRP